MGYNIFMEEELKKREEEIYDEWRKILSFWFLHSTLKLNEVLTIYLMQQKNDEKEINTK